MIHPTANIWGKGSIGSTTTIGAFCDIGDPDIGEGCKIQCHVSIPPGWKIGNRVFIGPGVHFSNDRHPSIQDIDFVPEKGVIEDDVVIGMGALVMPVHIGKGSLIGAGALVLEDVPPITLMVGVPAKAQGKP